MNKHFWEISVTRIFGLFPFSFNKFLDKCLNFHNIFSIKFNFKTDPRIFKLPMIQIPDENVKQTRFYILSNSVDILVVYMFYKTKWRDFFSSINTSEITIYFFPVQDSFHCFIQYFTTSPQNQKIIWGLKLSNSKIIMRMIISSNILMVRLL